MIRFSGITLVVALFTLLAASPLLRAQVGSIEGSIRDTEGRSLVGASVQVEQTSLGALSSVTGAFVIHKVPTGQHWIVARMIGYGQVRHRVTVTEGIAEVVSIVLPDSVIELGNVEVRSSRGRQQQDDTRTSVTRIEPRQAKYLPGAAEDVMRSLRSLPGVLSPNDFSAQLVVRGSGPDQNLIVLDDIEVFNPYRLYGLISMFNPETISDITLLTGGFPARYGDRLSAVLDVTNREGERDQTVTGKVNASLTNANLVLEGALPGGLRGGWLLSGRRTYYDLVAGPILKSMKLVDGDVALPNFRDLQFKALLRPWTQHSFVINALFNRDGTELTSGAERERVDSISVVDRSYNTIAGISWRFAPSAHMLSNTLASWYLNEGQTEFGGEGGGGLLYGDLSRDSVIVLMRALPPALRDSLRRRGIDPDNPPGLGINDGNASFNFTKYTLRNETSIQQGNHLLELGAGVDLIGTTLQFSAETDSLLKVLRSAQNRNSLPDSINESVEYYRLHAFVQDRITLGETLFLQLGGRLDYYRNIDRTYFSPRVSLSYAIDPLTTIRAATGIYYQSPGYEKAVDGRTFFDLTAPEVAVLKAERALHLVAGAERMLTEEWQLKGEAYYKSFSDLIVQKKVAGTRYVSNPLEGISQRYPSGWSRPIAESADSTTSIPINDATGEAYGFEILLQKIASSPDSKWSGWLSYALAWANRYRDGSTLPFSFDQRHTVNVVLNYRANDWLELGANFRYGSGFPYTPALGFQPIVIARADSVGEQRTSIATNIFGETLFRIDRGGVENNNSARLPDYHRLDLRATFYTDWWGLEWALYLDVINVYNHKNLLSRSYSVDRDAITLKTRDVSMFPILPTLGLSVKF